MTKYAKKVGEMIEKIDALCQAFQRHSNEYMEALGLAPDDLEKLKRISEEPMGLETDRAKKGFLNFTVEGEEIALFVMDVYGWPHRGDWTRSIGAVCLSNPALNDSVGRGKFFINVLREEWHSKVCRHLSEENDSS